MEIKLPTSGQVDGINKKMMYPSSNLQIISINKDKEVLWYDTKRKIVYAVDSTVPQIQRETLYASYDFGETWKAVYKTNYGIKRFFTSSSGHHFTWTTNTRMNRVSPDFSKTIMWTNGRASTPLGSYQSIAESNGVIMWAEYGTVDGTAYNIFKSTDDGVTWTIAKTGEEVRHWHALQVDPYTGHWWLCGGDTDEQSRILRSKDDGVTWELMGNGSQFYRTCGLVFTLNEVIWGTDAVSVTKIMKSNKNNWNPVEIGESPHQTTALGAAKSIDGMAIGWTRVEANSKQKETAVVWATDGKQVKTLYRMDISPEHTNGVIQPGISIATAVDDENRWFAYVNGASLSGTIGFVLPVGLFQ